MSRPPLSRNVYFSLSVLAGIAAGTAAFVLQRNLVLVAAAFGFYATYLAATWWNIPRLTSDFLRTHARQTDLPFTLMFGLVLAGFATSVGSLFQLINEAGDPDPLRLALGAAAVALAWFTIHTMFALHYAHSCWLDDDATDARQDDTPREKAVGLDFPGETEPGGWDFLYFAFVIGMTAQTADVDTTTTRLRRIVLTHSILTYFFNTVIVAAAVNLAVSLGR